MEKKRRPWEGRWHPQGRGPEVLVDDRDARDVVGSWLRRLGHLDADVVPAYGGIADVRAHGAAAGVRWRTAGEVEIDRVRQIAEAAGPDGDSFFFSGAGYTEQAAAWGRRPDCQTAMFLLRGDGRVKAVNRPAAEALEDAPHRAPHESWSRIKRWASLFAEYAVFLAALTAMLLAALTGYVVAVGAVSFEPGELGVATAVLSVGTVLGIRASAVLARRRVRGDDCPEICPEPQDRDLGSPAYRFHGIHSRR